MMLSVFLVPYLSSYMWLAVFSVILGGLLYETPVYSELMSLGSMGEVSSVSLSLMWLTWITYFVIYINETQGMGALVGFKEYWAVHMSLFLVLMGVFFVPSYISFYILFEITLVPMVMIILGWGYQTERIFASMSMVLYMLVASLPLLVVILSLEWGVSSSSFVLSKALFSSFPGCSGVTSVLTLGASMSFIVKFPMFFSHLWLPKAHVEAPLSGSMVLAGVLLKLGGYGMLQLSGLILNIKMMKWIASFSMVGGAWASVLCLRQVDLKVLIAYFSVSHMSVCLACCMSQLELALSGMLVILFSHGLCSSGLFAVSFALYSQVHSRNMLLSSGTLNVWPYFSKLVFFLVMANMATPPTLNFLGEVLSYVSVLNFASPIMAPAFVLLFMSVVVSVLMYISTQMGPASFRPGSEGGGSLGVISSLSLGVYVFALYLSILFLSFVL